MLPFAIYNMNMTTLTTKHIHTYPHYTHVVLFILIPLLLSFLKLRQISNTYIPHERFRAN